MIETAYINEQVCVYLENINGYQFDVTTNIEFIKKFGSKIIWPNQCSGEWRGHLFLDEKELEYIDRHFENLII